LAKKDASLAKETMSRQSDPPAAVSAFTAFGIRAAAEPLAPGLHVVATPIGNLRDMSLRALATLAAADLMLAEDTRVTKVLLAHYGISTPLAAYHEHNARRCARACWRGWRLATGWRWCRMREHRWSRTLAIVWSKMREGRACRDRGSGPVRRAGRAGGGRTADGPLLLRGLSGPAHGSAAGAPDRALAPFRRPSCCSNRRAVWRKCWPMPQAMLGARPAAVARELTKMHETVKRGTLPELAALYAAGETARGEIVVLIGQADDDAPERDDAALDAMLRTQLARLSLKDAVDVVAQESKIMRKQVYARAVALVKGRAP
jgi:16S rRNA (cytidine1402-2'-O)-methyltransferase